ncbi:hypothetical protein [Clostridium uliginosum]|uniref:Uncharacterized protein n=1 Tax=Clostridium uliginosum TaxID=119641 RepID=A0A1I1IZJ3_9CLOT|nr:hypothetical protein [Clostridium uliginosum]SFC41749.1 hypothetical protein SAMN05421842_103133 [Clostridium uliginosum]
MNEMGATWVNSKAYFTMLLPFFQFSEVKGAINPMKISFKITDKYRLYEFKNYIIKLFNLTQIDEIIWKQDRDKFLIEVEKIKEKNKDKSSLIKEEIRSVRKGRKAMLKLMS